VCEEVIEIARENPDEDVGSEDKKNADDTQDVIGDRPAEKPGDCYDDYSDSDVEEE